MASSSPRVVVLTPGPYNSAYFEHSFLAQQMGVELVEGRDLVVSDGFVWMRTTKGFERVDVIYRRIDDDFLDPTVFRADSMLGVPGLMDVYMAGRVALANAPGTGVADDKVDLRLRAEDREVLPGRRRSSCRTCRPTSARRNRTAATCWRTSRRWWSRRPTSPAATACSSDPHCLDEGAGGVRGEDSRRTRATTSRSRRCRCRASRPSSATPSRAATSICRPYILYGKDIFVLPGGLTRVALKKGSLVVNSSQGGGSKDTWVLAGDPRVDTDRPDVDAVMTAGASRSSRTMLSRVADSIYWMSRYIERAENVARFVDVNLQPDARLPGELRPAVAAARGHHRRHRGVRRAVRRRLRGRVIRFLTFDTEESQLDSVLPRAARENARSVREIISSAMWEQLNESYLMLTAAAGHRGASQPTRTSSSHRSGWPARPSPASPTRR